MLKIILGTLICFICFFKEIIGTESSLPLPIVKIPNGLVQGTVIQTSNGKVVYGFLGIPFAQPPIGSLKFKPPVPLTESWNTLFEANSLPNSCTQLESGVFPGFSGEEQWNPNTETSDDCLYINVWVSAEVFAIRNGTRRVPVLFWLYGGGLYSGSNTLDVYNGATLAAEKDLIFVSPQYRLGPHGYLYFNHPEAPGNVGFLDQNLALKWTHTNVELFGGNPDEITLIGESAGASSVGYHLLSPLSNTLFQRGILLSGVGTSGLAYKTTEESLEISYNLAKKVRCVNDDKPKGNVDEIIECLRTKASEDLHKAARQLSKGVLDIPFVATMDTNFLPEDPDLLITKWDTPRKDIMIGTVKDEGPYFQLYYYLKYFSRTEPSLIPYDGFVSIMKDIFKSYSKPEQDAIIFYYTNWINLEDGLKNQQLIGEAIGDAFFNCPERDFADKWSSRGNNVYYYYFTEHTDSDPWAEWMGVKHGDEIAYFLGQPLNTSDSRFTESEKELSRHVVNSIYNFMTVGKPAPNWSPYKKSLPVYVELNGATKSDKTYSDQYGPRANQCGFWNEYLPTLRQSLENHKYCNKRYSC